VIGVVCLFVALLCVLVPKANAAVAWHHGFYAPWGPEVTQYEQEWGDKLTGAMGADVIRIPVSWDAYQTGVGQYDNTVLDAVIKRVQKAREMSPYAFDPKAVVTFELPAVQKGWMLLAGYELTPGEKGVKENFARYYPASITGEKAYGQAMAKALKYLSQAQMGIAIETPNEPNLTEGPSWGIPAEYIGRLGAFGTVYAAAEGVPITSPGGPAVLVGSVATELSANQTENKTPEQYFRLVQTSTNYWINWWYLGAPNGQSTAELLMSTWRASFHAYPKLGASESSSCKMIWTSEGWKLQDQLGDRTGVAASSDVQSGLQPVLNVLDEVKWKKKWWITETGMTSYKTNNMSETEAQCVTRRYNGGSPYGKAEQESFYKELAYKLDTSYNYGSYPWKGFEGAIFFKPLDGTVNALDPYKGFGAFWPGCGNFCWKPAGIYFANTL
jgi:hypothetical protein